MSAMGVSTDRVGYVFVEINAEISEGKVLGFLEKINKTKLSFLTLLSLDDLPAYLEKISPPQLRSQI
ncbi:hypothetical protein H0902_18175 [Microcystis aeruginosa BLCCF108]|uniref:Uncharacterized protein n=2 Tax=Microcystis aeruginosa TaxID=1126 RepID=A0A841URL6_MICAE|nr:hypothetical protein [Microcystis aeruginosa BLCC-F108]